MSVSLITYSLHEIETLFVSISETDIHVITHYPEINIETFLKLKSAFFRLYTLRKINFLWCCFSLLQ